MTTAKTFFVAALLSTVAAASFAQKPAAATAPAAAASAPAHSASAVKTPHQKKHHSHKVDAAAPAASGTR